jgi:hypothetical protein
MWYSYHPTPFQFHLNQYIHVNIVIWFRDHIPSINTQIIDHKIDNQISRSGWVHLPTQTHSTSIHIRSYDELQGFIRWLDHPKIQIYPLWQKAIDIQLQDIKARPKEPNTCWSQIESTSRYLRFQCWSTYCYSAWYW